MFIEKRIMITQHEIFNEVDMEKIIVDLQGLGLSLKSVIFQLPDSVIKEYLLLEVSKIIEFKTVADFYYLQNKVTRMIEMVIRWSLDGEILNLLEEMSVGIRKIVRYIESEKKV